MDEGVARRGGRLMWVVDTCVKKRPIADVMIGAYALEKGGLITRNEEDFRSLYPTLRIFNPTTMTI